MLACNSGAWIDVACLATSTRNFPGERGTVIGILKSTLGAHTHMPGLQSKPHVACTPAHELFQGKPFFDHGTVCLPGGAGVRWAKCRKCKGRRGLRAPKEGLPATVITYHSKPLLQAQRV